MKAHPIFSTYTLHKHCLLYTMYIFLRLKAIMQFKAQEEVGKEDLCCFAVHGRSLLIPTDSMAILFKPKRTHFCPSVSQSLSRLKFRHSWAHPSLATMKRETYSLFANSPLRRRHDHCLSPLALTVLSQQLLSSGFMRCKVRKTATVPHRLGGDPTRRPEKCCTSHL